MEAAQGQAEANGRNQHRGAPEEEGAEPEAEVDAAQEDAQEDAPDSRQDAEVATEANTGGVGSLADGQSMHQGRVSL